MPAAFPFFRNFTASSTSSLTTKKFSVSVVRELLSFFMLPVARYENGSTVYSVHPFNTLAKHFNSQVNNGHHHFFILIPICSFLIF